MRTAFEARILYPATALARSRSVNALKVAPVQVMGMGAAAVIVAAVILISLSLHQVPTRGGSVLVDLHSASRFINPLLASTDTDAAVTSLIFPGPLGNGDDGSIVPNLASTWSVSRSGRLWTLRLRSGLRWGNGVPLTATDVAASYRLLAGPSFPTHAGAWNGVTITVPSSLTVEFHLPRADYTFAQELTTGVIPFKAASLPAPVGSGPFQLDSVRRAAISVRPSNAGSPESPFLSRITFSTASGLRQRPDLRCRSTFAPQPGGITVPTTRLLGLVVNVGITRQRRVRLALLGALGIAASPTGGDLLAPLPTWPSPPAAPAVSPGPTTLLRRAGWHLRQGQWRRKNQVLAISLAAASDPLENRFVDAVKDAWTALHVRVVVVRRPFPDLIRTVLYRGDFQAALIEWDFASADYNPATFWAHDAPLNFSRVHDPLLERMVSAVAGQPSPAARVALRQRAARRIVHDGAGIGLAFQQYRCSLGPGLKGFTAPTLVSDAGGLFSGAAGWYTSSHLVLGNPFS